VRRLDPAARKRVLARLGEADTPSVFRMSARRRLAIAATIGMVATGIAGIWLANFSASRHVAAPLIRSTLEMDVVANRSHQSMEMDIRAWRVLRASYRTDE